MFYLSIIVANLYLFYKNIQQYLTPIPHPWIITLFSPQRIWGSISTIIVSRPGSYSLKIVFAHQLLALDVCVCNLRKTGVICGRQIGETFLFRVVRKCRALAYRRKGPHPRNQTFSEDSFANSEEIMILTMKNPNQGRIFDIDQLRTPFNEDCKGGIEFYCPMRKL